MFWQEKKTGATFLFLANRYATLLNYGFTLFTEFPPSQSLLAYTVSQLVLLMQCGIDNEVIAVSRLTVLRGTRMKRIQTLSTLVMSRAQAIISVFPYIIWAGAYYGLIRWRPSHNKSAFSALRTYAVSGKNLLVAAVVFLLSMSTLAVNVVRCLLHDCARV